MSHALTPDGFHIQPLAFVLFKAKLNPPLYIIAKNCWYRDGHRVLDMANSHNPGVRTWLKSVSF